jgi:chemotaxis response regulator CheB
MPRHPWRAAKDPSKLSHNDIARLPRGIPQRRSKDWGDRLAHRNIIVIGCSVGGVEALQKLVAGLPENFSSVHFCGVAPFAARHQRAAANSFACRQSAGSPPARQ